MLSRRQAETKDIAIELVELWAAVADLLSYYQDEVASEAYLGPARHRAMARACRRRHRKFARRLLILAASLAAVVVYVRPWTRDGKQ
jgi:hypothetical protein